MDEPIPLLYYDDDNDNNIAPTSLFPEVAHSEPAQLSSTSTAAPSVAPIGRDVLPDVSFGDTTTIVPSGINSLAPIVDWNGNTGKGECSLMKNYPGSLKYLLNMYWVSPN